MSTYVSPAAQFAAAAAAEAEAEAAGAPEVSEVDQQLAEMTPFLAICPAAPPGYVPPVFEHDLEPMAVAVAVAVSDDVAVSADSAVGSDAGDERPPLATAEAGAGAKHRRGGGAAAPDLADETAFPALGGGGSGPPSAGAAKKPAWSSAGGAVAAAAAPTRATEVLDLPLMQAEAGAAVRRIMARTGARIDVSHNAALGTSTYVVSGAAAAVAAAKRDVCAALSPRITRVVDVPAEARAAVAKAASAIGAAAGATVQVGRASPSGLDAAFETVAVSVSGTVAAVASAVAAVEAAADRRTTCRVARVSVPRDALALVVGRQAAGLHALKDAHPGVAVHVPGPGAAGGDASVIRVAGEPALAAACAAAIKSAADAAMAASQVADVPVDRRQHRFVAGTGGAGLRDIALATGCAVSLPPARVAADIIRVRGAPDALAAAVAMVRARASERAADAFDATRAHPAYARPALYAHRALRYLRSRERLRRVEAEHGVELSGAEGVIEIVGPSAAAVGGACEALGALFAALPPHHFNGMDVDAHQADALREWHAAAGPRLQATRSVCVLIPAAGDHASAGALVVYEGFNADVERLGDAPAREAATRELLRATLEEMRAAMAAAGAASAVLAAHVPAGLQAALRARAAEVLGADGAHVALRFGALEGEQPAAGSRKAVAPLAADCVEVRGPPDAAARVVAELERRARHVSETVAVPAGLVARVVGRGGDALRRLRGTRDVTVDVTPGGVARVAGVADDVAAVAADLRALVAKMGDDAAETVDVAHALHGALLAGGGRFVQRLRDKYAVRIQFPAKDGAGADLGADQIRIRGSREAVAEARAELLELAAYEAEHAHSARVSVPAASLPHVVGRGGARISEIKDATATRIDVGAPGTGAADVTIAVTGTRAGVAAAVAAIEAVAAEHAALDDAAVDVPPRHHRFLIGSGGARVRELVAAAGGDPDATSGPRACRVQFPRAAGGDSLIRLRGDRAVVAAVRARIEELVAERERVVTVLVPVPQAQHAFVIGRGGARLKQLQDAHAVEIRFPRGADAAEDVRVTGLPDACAAARDALLALVRDEARVTVPLAFHRRLGGRSSAMWRRLRADHSVQVDAARVDRHPQPAPPTESEEPAGDLIFADADAGLDGLSAEWVLRGDAAGLPPALAAIDAALAEAAAAPPAVEARLRVDPRFHRHIIGKNGAAVAKIRDATACDVAVPPRTASTPWVTVAGPRPDVERAIEMIREAIEIHD
ncbi:hypothetical protein H4R26_003077 [Coemansia thaxteri]|uniref:K Homology domain-containing protein n=1 Tax=Coemansia thaxteri TaxID=2663907 RepID=A0A9W8BJS1_9FUNG|nr:hypothetical protein H4R26_003077 [Coemansia thaxteri]